MAPPFGWVTPAGYTFDNLGTCSSCRAAIAWTYTAKSNRAPLDRDGVSHFATCPNAADHRRKPPTAAGDPPATALGDPRYVPGPPTTGGENSREAAAAVASGTARQRADVLAAIAQRDGVAEWELEGVLAMSGNSIRPRLAELEARGLVHRDGKKVRPSSGRTTWLYRATKQEAP